MRRLLHAPPLPSAEPAGPATTDYRDRYAALTDSSLRRCPRCDDGNMRINQFVATAVAEEVSALRTAAFLSYRASRVDAARRVLRRGGGHPP